MPSDPIIHKVIMPKKEWYVHLNYLLFNQQKNLNAAPCFPSCRGNCLARIRYQIKGRASTFHKKGRHFYEGEERGSFYDCVLADLGKGKTAISNKGRQISTALFFSVFLRQKKADNNASISAQW
jgi:hypothetical protein